MLFQRELEEVTTAPSKSSSSSSSNGRKGSRLKTFHLGCQPKRKSREKTENSAYFPKSGLLKHFLWQRIPFKLTGCWQLSCLKTGQKVSLWPLGKSEENVAKVRPSVQNSFSFVLFAWCHFHFLVSLSLALKTRLHFTDTLPYLTGSVLQLNFTQKNAKRFSTLAPIYSARKQRIQHKIHYLVDCNSATLCLWKFKKNYG